MLKILAGMVGITTIVLGLILWHSIMVFVKAPDSLFFLFWSYMVSVVVLFVLKVASELE